MLIPPNTHIMEHLVSLTCAQGFSFEMLHYLTNEWWNEKFTGFFLHWYLIFLL